MINCFDGEYAFLSNFYFSPMIIDNVVYTTNEHFFQAMKSLNPKERQAIILAPTPGKAKRLGRKVSLRKDWEDIKEEVAEDTVSNLKQTSPKKTGKYAKSWKVTKKGTKYIVHAKPPYHRLTHLLERGHAKVNGGRVPGKVHIAPAEEKAPKKRAPKKKK